MSDEGHVQDTGGEGAVRPRGLAMLTAAAPIRRQNMTVVQAMRGIAAFWVLLFHAAEGGHVDSLLIAINGPLRTVLFNWGHYGVAIFFPLSGFVIAHSLAGARVDGRFFGRFLLRRSIRLDPPYWGAIILCLLFGWISAQVKGEYFALPPGGDILAHLLYVQEIVGVREINSVFWTLTYEVQFYIILCLALMIEHRMREAGWRRASQAIVLLLFGIAVWSATGLTDMLNPGVFIRLWYAFFLGVLAYWSLSRPVVRVAFLILLAMIAVPQWRDDYGFGLVSAASALILCGGGMTGWLYSGLRWRWLQCLGLISYSLYLLHNPVTGAVGFIVQEGVGNDLVANLLSLTLIVAASVGLAGGYFRWVERPIHRLSRRVVL